MVASLSLCQLAKLNNQQEEEINRFRQNLGDLQKIHFQVLSNKVSRDVLSSFIKTHQCVLFFFTAHPEYFTDHSSHEWPKINDQRFIKIMDSLNEKVRTSINDFKRYFPDPLN